MYFPLTDGKLRQAMILFSKSVTWIYIRSLEHSWALESEIMSYICAQEEEGANISRQTVERISTKEDADLGCSAASRKEGEYGQAAGGETGAEKVS